MSQDEQRGKQTAGTSAMVRLSAFVREYRVCWEVLPVVVIPPADSNSITDEEYHRASRVVTGWIRDPHFGDGKGHPRPLRMDGKGVSFNQLVNHYSGDIPVRALLDELPSLFTSHY